MAISQRSRDSAKLARHSSARSESVVTADVNQTLSPKKWPVKACLPASWRIEIEAATALGIPTESRLARGGALLCAAQARGRTREGHQGTRNWRPRAPDWIPTPRTYAHRQFKLVVELLLANLRPAAELGQCLPNLDQFRLGRIRRRQDEIVGVDPEELGLRSGLLVTSRHSHYESSVRFGASAVEFLSSVAWFFA